MDSMYCEIPDESAAASRRRERRSYREAGNERCPDGDCPREG
jgi:hypothetical protein